MYNATQDIKDAIRADARAWRSRLALTGGGYIYGVEDVSYTNGSQSGQNITVGSVIAPTIKITLTDTINSATGQPIKLTGREFVWQLGVFPDITEFTGNEPDDAYTYIPIGKFTIDKVKQNGTRYEAECSHKLSKADAVHNTALSFPTSAFNLMQEVVNSLALSFAPDYNQRYALQQIAIMGLPDGATKRDIMGWVGALLGGFVCADRDGYVIIKWYEDSGYSVPVNAISEPEISEQQVTYTAVVCTVDNETTYTDGTGNAMAFNCPFMTQGQFSAISPLLKNFSYRPCKLTYLLGDPLIDPWDIIGFGSSYTMPAATITLEHKGGVTGTIEAKTAKNEAQAGHVDPINRAVARLVDMIDENKGEIEQDIADAISEATEAIRGGANGYFYIITDANGINKETIWCDNINPQSATHGIRINSAGIGFWTSSSGGNVFDGPYTQAWTIDGTLIADFIKAGTLRGITIICNSGTIGGWNITDRAIVSPDEQVRLDSTYYEPKMTHSRLRALSKKNSQLRSYTHNEIRMLEKQSAGKAQVSASKDADTASLRDGKLSIERAGKMQLEINGDQIKSGTNNSYIKQSPTEILSDVGNVEHISVTAKNSSDVSELVAEWYKSVPSSWTPFTTPGCWHFPELFVSENVHSNRINVHTAAYISGLVQAGFFETTGGPGIKIKGRYDSYTPSDQIRAHGGVNYYDPDNSYVAGARPALIDGEYGLALSYPAAGDTSFIGLWAEQNTDSAEKYNTPIVGFFKTDNAIKTRKPLWAYNDIALTTMYGHDTLEHLRINRQYIEFKYTTATAAQNIGRISVQSSNSIDTMLQDGSKIRWTIGSGGTTTSTVMEYLTSDDQVHIRRDTNLHNNNLLNAVISSSSDERLKDNISPCKKDCLSIIKDLNLIEFDWKDGSGHEEIGFSAQQAGRVSPDLRGEDADGYSTVREGRLIRYLVGAVQQLQKELEEFKNGTKFSDDERK